MKDAAAAAQRGQCCELGCDARPTWLQADHIIPWTPNDPGQSAGRTATHNLQMLCGNGNHAKSNRPNPPPPTPPARPNTTRPPRSETATPRHSTRSTDPPNGGPEPGSHPGTRRDEPPDDGPEPGSRPASGPTDPPTDRDQPGSPPHQPTARPPAPRSR
jgi:hypothetical protein